MATRAGRKGKNAKPLFNQCGFHEGRRGDEMLGKWMEKVTLNTGSALKATKILILRWLIFFNFFSHVGVLG